MYELQVGHALADARRSRIAWLGVAARDQAGQPESWRSAAHVVGKLVVGCHNSGASFRRGNCPGVTAQGSAGAAAPAPTQVGLDGQRSAAITAGKSQRELSRYLVTIRRAVGGRDVKG